MQWFAQEILATTSLALHLWCVNVAAGGPLMAVLLRWQARRHGSPLLDRQARSLGMISLATLAAGATTGLALAGTMWQAGDRGLFQILPSFSYKIHWALWELVFYVVCMAGYIALFGERWSARRGLRALQSILAILASTNLLYHFPPLFTVMSQLADRPESVVASVGPREFRELMMQGYVAALSVHVGLASLAVAAVVALRQLVHAEATADDASAVTPATRAIAGVALTATAAQLLVGVWLLVSLNPLAQTRLLGGDLWGTIGLCLAVLATFALLNRLASATFSYVTRVDVRQITIWLAVIVFLMTVALRRAESRPAAPPSAEGSSTQRPDI